MKRKPENTEITTGNKPQKVLGYMMKVGNNEILQQESEGQLSFVNSDTLPTKIDDISKLALEKAGVKFGDVVGDDPLFQYVELPDGWTKLADGHSMHSYLVDEQGRHRAHIFYKAAFYDRKARISANRRFNYGLDYSKQDEGFAVGIVKDCFTTIWSTESIAIDYPSESAFKILDEQEAKAREWVEVNYPNWRDPSAYWQ